MVRHKEASTRGPSKGWTGAGITQMGPSKREEWTLADETWTGKHRWTHFSVLKRLDKREKVAMKWGECGGITILEIRVDTGQCGKGLFLT